jgi:hypothetical protein
MARVGEAEDVPGVLQDGMLATATGAQKRNRRVLAYSMAQRAPSVLR